MLTCTYRICYESKRKQLDRLEQLVARGLRQVFAVVDKDVSALLAVHQDKADFVGSEANMSLASSRACRRCADYLQPLLSAACAVLVRLSSSCCLGWLSTWPRHTNVA